jgi:predicted metal-dependent hydrolase
VPLPQTLVFRLGDDNLPLLLVHNRRARRYLLRLGGDGGIRVTIPRHGSQAEALRFVERQRDWIAEHRPKVLARKANVRQPLIGGGEILFRGEKIVLTVIEEEKFQRAVFENQAIKSRIPPGDWRPLLEIHLRRLAANEFPKQVAALAKEHGLEVNRVSIRDQRSRWGSCSARKTISLNWRLIMAPPRVLDYVIVHELMHLREMNHSTRFWKHVAQAFPSHREAEQWLKRFGKELR